MNKADKLPSDTIYLQQNEDGFWTNLPQIASDYGNGGYMWGKDSEQTAELALNIIQWALLRQGYDGPVVETNDGNQVFAFGYIMHKEYGQEVLAKLPAEGGKLLLGDVLQFIDTFPHLRPFGTDCD